eukprot:TRINITY_DN2141_c0_g1_i2.p2 TRINITY_DN2141_c0_g1~~TRINITY_DN2141_c0_g1_i2.p2  ORF type:complete len:143 (+),score=50.35 TRINITY_DN2141_c0_g1_i2:61-489(+)
MDPNAPFLIVAVLIGVFLLIWSSVRSPGPTAEQVALGQHKNKKKVIPNMMEKFDKSKYAGKEEWTWEEVAQHNKADDCFLVVDGNVYDVTTFISRHPGGAAIYKNAGKDNTEGFHGQQHGTSAFEAIEEFHIGKIVDSKKSK